MSKPVSRKAVGLVINPVDLSVVVMIRDGFVEFEAIVTRKKFVVGRDH
ncbi:MAG: hypothetical protein R2942_02010 [Ignavibacteria bacterium]